MARPGKSETAEQTSSDEHPAAREHDSGYSLFTGIWSVLLSVLGAGQLTLPYAFAELGWAAGLGFLVTFALLGIYSLHTLSMHSMSRELEARMGPSQSLLAKPQATRLRCHSSYTDLAVDKLGPRAKPVCDFLLFAYAWGGAVAFMIILKGELGYLALRAFGWAAGSSALLNDSVLLAIVSVAVVLPLSSMQNPAALKRFSPLGSAAALFIVAVVLASADWEADSSSFAGILGVCKTMPFADGAQFRRYPRSFFSTMAALPLLSFALNSSWAFIPILAGLGQKTPSRVSCLIWSSSVAIAVDYALLALVGSATFCSAVDPNILTSLGQTCSEGWNCGIVLAAKAALAVQLTVALPLRFFVSRSVVCASWPQTLQMRWLGAALLVLSAAVLAASPLQLSVAIGVTSSICASAIIYIIPALIDLSVGTEASASSMLRRACSVLSLVLGSTLLVAGTITNLMGAGVGA